MLNVELPPTACTFLQSKQINIFLCYCVVTLHPVTPKMPLIIDFQRRSKFYVPNVWREDTN